MINYKDLVEYQCGASGLKINVYTTEDAKVVFRCKDCVMLQGGYCRGPALLKRLIDITDTRRMGLKRVGLISDTRSEKHKSETCEFYCPKAEDKTALTESVAEAWTLLQCSYCDFANSCQGPVARKMSKANKPIRRRGRPRKVQEEGVEAYV